MSISRCHLFLEGPFHFSCGRVTGQRAARQGRVNKSCNAGVSGVSRVLYTDPESEGIQQPDALPAADQVEVPQQRLTVKDVGLKHLLHSSQPQGTLKNVKQT